MPSNKISNYLGISSFGESHGTAIGVLIDGVIPNIPFPTAQIIKALNRRRPHGTYSTSRLEEDQFEIVSGVFEGLTTGMPICILIRNREYHTDDYDNLKDVFRPGHADFSWFNKFKIYDYRGGGRSSGRETVARVLAAELYRHFLPEVVFYYDTIRIGALTSDSVSYSTYLESNPFYWNDSRGTTPLYSYLDDIKAQNDSVGGIVKICIGGIPVGLGDPVYEKLDANISKALMSIGSVKGVLFGDGLELGMLRGSQVNDPITPSGMSTNHLGGINGGISNGMPLTLSVVIRPIPSIGIEQQTISQTGEPTVIQIQGRHDVCHVSRVIPVIEAMLIITLAEALHMQGMINGAIPSLTDYRDDLDKIDEDIVLAIYRRKQIVDKVKQLKSEQNIAPLDTQREAAIFQNTTEFAEALGLNGAKAAEIIRQAIEICR
ncbi:MAG: chorismate synthase [Candidatus Cloacimonetes bacterium HGW-Cloacimonetes-1]|jgi:chorismate synthase|nr:MAG: chorismate synthase [Candidatus Cloacimonetes bacterium HGW-Cloacimonetes-1]